MPFDGDVSVLAQAVGTSFCVLRLSLPLTSKWQHSFSDLSTRSILDSSQHNVTGAVVDLVGQFIGESRRRGNYIAGTQNFLPHRLELLRGLIWEHHMTLCLSCGKPYGLPINDATRIHMNHSFAIWQSWMRLPGQRWCFLKNDSQTWKEIMEGEQSQGAHPVCHNH
jgi:hypothetical protein